MSVNIVYKQLVNLSANDDLLKKIVRDINIISVDEQTMVIEISSCLASKNNSILIHFIVEDDSQKFEVEMTCKVTDFESHNNVARLGLRLIQYNKKEWADFCNLMTDKQNFSIELLKNMRGR
jgi:hypothetical protein